MRRAGSAYLGHTGQRHRSPSTWGELLGSRSLFVGVVGPRELYGADRQKPLEVLTARAASAQVGSDSWVSLLGRCTGDGQLGVDVQHLHRLGTADVARSVPRKR